MVEATAGGGGGIEDGAAAAAERAVSESDGSGGESSGSGRPEWGTWCDEELFAEVERRATTERVFVKTWLPMHKLPMHNEPRLSLIRAINRRDPKMSMVR